jgi:hypothetical protein
LCQIFWNYVLGSASALFGASAVVLVIIVSGRAVRWVLRGVGGAPPVQVGSSKRCGDEELGGLFRAVVGLRFARVGNTEERSDEGVALRLRYRPRVASRLGSKPFCFLGCGQPETVGPSI